MVSMSAWQVFILLRTARVEIEICLYYIILNLMAILTSAGT